MASGGSWVDLLEGVRRDRFVGRRTELALFEEALAEPKGEPLVLFVHGPGGIGKSRLLATCSDAATDVGSPVCRLSARDLSAGSSGIESRVRDALPGDTAERPVLLIDDYEQVGAELDDWIRQDLLTGLPVRTVTVLAGRAPPRSSWRIDDGWRQVLRVVALRNLSSADCRSYLTRRTVGPAHHDSLVAASRGHPLALSLLADTVEQSGGDLPIDATTLLSPDLVSLLVAQFLDCVPDSAQREAVEVCALARLTTEALLRDVVGGADAGELFAWLAGLSFVDLRPGGLEPHDLARDVIDRDLRRRDPERYAALFRGVRGHVHGRIRGLRGRPQQHAIFDEKFLFRNLPSILSPVDWETWGQLFPDPATPADREVVLGLVGAAEGDASREVAERWWAEQPEAFFIQRRADGSPRGMLALVELTSAAEQADLSWDPVADAALQHAHKTAPPRPGELVTHTRFVVDAETYQGPSPTVNAIPVLTIQRYLSQPTLSWDFLTLHEPDLMDPYFAVADLPRVPGADVAHGGRRYGMYAHDFRVRPVDEWLDLVTERALAQDPVLPPAVESETSLLSHPDFHTAVHDALRSFGDAEVLERSPLLRTRMARDHAQRTSGAAASAATLRVCLASAVEALGGDARGEKQRRTLVRTYLAGPTTQEGAAAALGLPFSTYRRHLSAGVDRVAERLWSAEVYGPH